jgi:hypothetical protein
VIESDDDEDIADDSDDDEEADLQTLLKNKQQE